MRHAKQTLRRKARNAKEMDDRKTEKKNQRKNWVNNKSNVKSYSKTEQWRRSDSYIRGK